MPRTPDMRVSVAKYNRDYVQRISSNLGCTHSEATNFIIAKVRLGESVSPEAIEKIVDVKSSFVEHEHPQLDVSFPKEFYQEMDEIIDQFVPDPVIERLLTEGLELSF
jgi:hypothetical protein